MIALSQGDVDTAFDRASKAWELLDRRGEPERLVSRAFMAACLARMGRHDEATTMIDNVEQLIDAEASHGVTSFEGMARCAEVWLSAHAAGHEPHEAFARARKAHDRLRKFSKQYPVAKPRVATLAAAMARAQGKPAEPLFQEARSLGEQHGMPYEVDYAAALESTVLKTSADRLPPVPQRP